MKGYARMVRSQNEIKQKTAYQTWIQINEVITLNIPAQSKILECYIKSIHFADKNGQTK